MRGFDIAVAGCGPAGLAAALLLHRAGHRVTVFERFDAPRPIGSGLMLQPTGMAVLDRLGLLPNRLALGQRVERLFGQADGRTVLNVRYETLGRRRDQPVAFGLGIHRASLFAVLHRAVAAAGIAMVTSHEISGSEGDGARRRLTFVGHDASPSFDLIVDALGSRSALAPPTGRTLDYGALWASLGWPDGAGFDIHALEQRYHRASRMAGVLPIGTPPEASGPQAAFFWSLRRDRLDAWRDAGLDAWKAEARALWPATEPLLDQITAPDQMTFARYAHRTLPRPVEPALIHIGDAWHSASPQLGQGANMALLDAWALARGLAAESGVDAALNHAVRLRRRHVLLYQGLTALFTPVYQSDSRVLPVLRDRLVGPLSKLWPATRVQAAMVAGTVGSPLRRLGLE